MTSKNQTPTIFVCDGNWYAHRAYFTVKSQRLEQALTRNFLSLLFRDALATRSKYILVAFDGPRIFRYGILPTYKANRSKENSLKKGGPDTDPLYTALPYLMDALEVLGIAWTQPLKYEADDVLASAAAQYAKFNVALGGEDKDLHQTLRPGVYQYISKDLARKRTHKDVEKKYGLEPAQMVDYQTLIGDSVDNIAPIPGFGPATAKALLEKYGSLKEWRKDKANKELAIKLQARMELNRKLVRLVTTCPLPDVAALTPAKLKETKSVNIQHEDQALPNTLWAYQSWLYPKTKGLF